MLHAKHLCHLTLVPALLYTTVSSNNNIQAHSILVTVAVSSAFWVCLLIKSETVLHPLGPYDREHSTLGWESTAKTGFPPESLVGNQTRRPGSEIWGFIERATGWLSL